MRFTRRLTERRSSRVFVMLSSATIAGAVWSCASDEEANPRPDPATDASPDAVVPEGGATEDVTARRDAGFIDAAPPPVVCASSPCAIALVTSASNSSSRLDEGYCALMQDGTVVCWGSNASGQLGRGEEAGLDDSATPARVIDLANVVSLHHSCAVDKDGAAFCWGTGPFAGSGVAIITARAPVRLPIPAASHVDATQDTACAVTGETVRCWGLNANAQVGPFTTTPRDGMHEPANVPLAVAGPIRDLAVSRATFVLHADGTMESWGANPPLARPSPLFPDPYAQPVSIPGTSNLDLADDNA
ncbi:MAG: hypothetical protein K0S65_366, partial [Labilithrix sp.]|nr:hypothetical protein [Labilithrix sp.]